MRRPRVGVIGYGYIGQDLVRRISDATSGMELAFVHNRTPDHLRDLPPDLVLDDLGAVVGSGDVDLVVEASHPSITSRWGVELLKNSHYLPLSTTALVDDDLRSALLRTASEYRHDLFLPAGALVGGDTLAMRPDAWERVKVTFRKNPANLDLRESGIDPESIVTATTIFSGSARDVAVRFPRNVNTMVTCALLSVGLDRCECAVVADPGLDRAVAEVEAWGHDGGYLRTDKRQPAVGVSGTEMLDSVWFSVARALDIGTSGAPRLV